MGLDSVLVSYGSMDKQRKLEAYIGRKTGRKVDFGPLGYGGECTILNISLDLAKINHTNVTGAIWFPGKKFRGEIDEFIEWHTRITEMHYPEAVNELKDSEDVIALYYEKENGRISYSCFRAFDKESIKKHFSTTLGKIEVCSHERYDYWLLSGKDDGNMIMFRKTEYLEHPFRHIDSDDGSLGFFKSLISRNTQD